MGTPLLPSWPCHRTPGGCQAPPPPFSADPLGSGPLGKAIWPLGPGLPWGPLEGVPSRLAGLKADRAPEAAALGRLGSAGLVSLPGVLSDRAEGGSGLEPCCAGVAWEG